MLKGFKKDCSIFPTNIGIIFFIHEDSTYLFIMIVTPHLVWTLRCFRHLDFSTFLLSSICGRCLNRKDTQISSKNNHVFLYTHILWVGVGDTFLLCVSVINDNQQLLKAVPDSWRFFSLAVNLLQFSSIEL